MSEHLQAFLIGVVCKLMTLIDDKTITRRLDIYFDHRGDRYQLRIKKQRKYF